MSTVLMVGATLLLLATLAGLVRHNHWGFRVFDFPRLQWIALILLVLAGFAWLVPPQPAHLPWVVALLLALAYQLWMVLPYTPLWPVEVQRSPHQDPARRVSLLVSNVLGTNRHHDRLIRLIEIQQPDVVLTLESDRHWQAALDAALADQYAHRVAVPLDNLYGMHLYSRLPLLDPEVRYLFDDDIPSIHTGLQLRHGHVVQLYCLHPKPPSPTEADDSTLRDAELLLVGRHIAQNPHSAIVWGDLNDVAWSRTNQLFQRVSGLLDPRVGRKMLNTFHAQYRWLRWALDHVFHSGDFALVRIERMPDIGSDHFPVLTVLDHVPALKDQQEKAPAAPAEVAEARQKIAEGVEEAAEGTEAAAVAPTQPTT